jgi:tetratricopeptide repeat protein
MPTCFVITGYGIKKDYINNRDIDLDKSYKHIIKPVFEELGYECKRSCDYPPGIIDIVMYKGIYNADFVLADISTLNPNALYELGVRHALKPYTTLVICEDGIFVNSKLPFDLSHLTALPYHHDGKSLDIDEVERFTKVLKDAVTGMLRVHDTDSPVFANIKGLNVGIRDNDLVVASIAANKRLPDVTESLATAPTLSDMIDTAVAAIKNKQFDSAIDLFTQLLLIKPKDPFITQQLCLATYKSEKPDPISANEAAYKILQKLNPQTSIDTETLGLSGATHKNLFRLTGDKTWLEKSLRFYERGYYIANDYYNGINTAFLYWTMASLGANKDEVLFYKMQARQIAKHVIEICNSLLKSEDYEKRKDREWIANTLAEAYFGLDDMDSFDKIIEQRKKEQNNFSEDSFIKQFEELKTLKQKVEEMLK